MFGRQRCAEGYNSGAKGSITERYGRLSAVQRYITSSKRKVPNIDTNTTILYRRSSLLQRKLFLTVSSSFTTGHAVAQWLRHCATNRKVAGSIPDGVRPHYGPGVDSASHRNDYRNISWG
jgi:hypothetical protein